MWNYYNPVEIIFGEKKFSSIESILENKKYIIITHPEDIFKQYSDQLSNSPNPPLMIMTDVQPNPDYLNILSLLNNFSLIDQKIDLILAIGGGSVIDTAKALSAFKGDQTLLTDFIRNNQKPHIVDPINIFAVPTTSGTSSELTCWATIWDKEKKKKFSLSHHSLYPIKAIIDPAIMLNKPKELTISTGLDALSHSMESIWNINANPISAIHGIAGSKLIIENLPFLVEDLQNIKLRSNIARACIHAGLAFSNTKTAIAHNISYPITINYGVQHGIACSFSLPIVLRSMEGINQEAEIRLQKIFNDTIDNSASKLENMLRKLNVPLNLNELQINKNDWDQIVNDAFMGERGKNFLGNIDNFNKAVKVSNFFNS